MEKTLCNIFKGYKIYKLYALCLQLCKKYILKSLKGKKKSKRKYHKFQLVALGDSK